MKRLLAPAALAAAALLVALVPAVAPAGVGDRNKDRIPDRWERAQGLSLKVKQTNKDQDRDGLRNLAEWRNKTDPLDADSDDDGLDDGDEVKVGSSPRDRDDDDDGTLDDEENAGTIQSFAGGKLTIALAGGGRLSAAVVDGITEIECEQADKPASPTARDDDDGDDDDGGHGDDDDGEHDGDDDRSTCTAADLTAGAVIHEAEVTVTGGRAVFSEIEILR